MSLNFFHVIIHFHIRQHASCFMHIWFGCIWWIFNITGADIWIYDLHALQQYIRIHITQDISNFNVFGSFVWCVMDLCRCLLLRDSFQRFYFERNKREKFKWMSTKEEPTKWCVGSDEHRLTMSYHIWNSIFVTNVM